MKRDRRGDRVKFSNGGITIVYEYRGAWRGGGWVCGYCSAIISDPVKHSLSHSEYRDLCMDFMWKATKS